MAKSEGINIGYDRISYQLPNKHCKRCLCNLRDEPITKVRFDENGNRELYCGFCFGYLFSKEKI